MSKSRGTFIKASDYLKYLDPEFLRYYFASKLNESIEDIDLNFDDLIKKVNSDLIGKLINLASRCSAFLDKNSNLMLSEVLEDKDRFQDFVNNIDEVKEFYSQRCYWNDSRCMVGLGTWPSNARTFISRTGYNTELTRGYSI